jgi:hypothetical protein
MINNVHFILQTITSVSNSDVNTGFFLVKATEQTRELMESWYHLQVRHGFCKGPADQLSFQEVILEKNHIANYSLKNCLEYEHSSPYHGRRKCSMSKLHGELKKSHETLSPQRKENGYNTLPLGKMSVYLAVTRRPPFSAISVMANKRDA